MGRICREIEANGDKLWTLFDSGSRNSYILEGAAKRLVRQPLPAERTAALGGKVHRVSQTCILVASIEGHSVDTHARVVDEIGTDETGRPIQVLFGALAMQEWGIGLDVKNERLDFTHYSTDFVEF